MAYVLIFTCFAVLAVASLLAARVGYRGQACNRAIGYDVPAAVKRDPALERQANQLLAFWCTGAALLSLAALVPIGSVLLSGGGRSVSPWGLMAFAVYGLAVVAVVAYPFEKIKRLSGD
ncbi:hypothetical protein [Streptomyces sp. TLI_146]|uniref:hypothetical protein n=1 Tax=Streptomyces sp. TLI_146 TaxID=1938858 RepID=UPI000C6FF74F|nr:hypothetical protein [Streptomyces sp. TLI_146]PKV90167.1 hypothetical protein BX283_7849 [Streptomyces sp. TLI_146]